MVPDYALELGLARIGAPHSFITWVKRTMKGHRRMVKTRSGLSRESAAFDLAGMA